LAEEALCGSFYHIGRVERERKKKEIIEPESLLMYLYELNTFLFFLFLWFSPKPRGIKNHEWELYGD
jgi:hypothetical protein